MHNEAPVTMRAEHNIETKYVAIVKDFVEILARRLFWAMFPIWLSDLHIGRIIVLEGANLIQFENESERRRRALIEVNESKA